MEARLIRTNFRRGLICQISSINCPIFVCVSSFADVALARLFENAGMNECPIEKFFVLAMKTFLG